MFFYSYIFPCLIMMNSGYTPDYQSFVTFLHLAMNFSAIGFS